jgi:hypothetical protein
MVINITLGRAMLDRFMLDRGRAVAFVGLVGAACPKAVHPVARVITTAEKKAKKRASMRLLRRWLLLRASRLLVCLRRQSLGGQCLG